MKKYIIFVGFLLFGSLNVFGQVISAKQKWSVALGLGLPSSVDLIGHELSQDLSAYKSFRYRVGIAVNIRYEWSNKWSVCAVWNRSGSVAVREATPKFQYTLRRITGNSFSVLFERRFAVSDKSFFYTRFGGGLYAEHHDKPSNSTGRRIQFTNTIPMPQITPVGVSSNTDRLLVFLETGLFTLPLLQGGFRWRLGKSAKFAA